MPITRYELDPTGSNPNNLVQGEQHTLTTNAVRIIAPKYGAFFVNNALTVIDRDNGHVLVRGTDYEPAELLATPSAKYGKEICSIILVKNSAVSNNITIGYQALGAEYSYCYDSLVRMIKALELDNRGVLYQNIINLPDQFTPAPHLHDAGDLYGFEYLVSAVERLTRAIAQGDDASHRLILDYIDQEINAIKVNYTWTDIVNAIELALNPYQTSLSEVAEGLIVQQEYALNLHTQIETLNQDMQVVTAKQLTSDEVMSTIVSSIITSFNNATAILQS